MRLKWNLLTMQSKYDSYSEGSSQSFDDIELIHSVHSMVQGKLSRFFGTTNDWGQTVGLAMEDVVLEDGGLYLDPEKGKVKTFSWDSILGVTPQEIYENEDEVLDASDAHERLSKEYANNSKTYNLIAARIPEHTDDDGDVIIPASSVARSFERDGDGWDFGDFDDLEGDLPPVADETISWYGGNAEYGPSASTLRMVGLLAGEQYIADGDDLYGFLTDTNSDNLLRDDLEGREVRFFVTRRTAEESGRDYNYVVFEDLKTGEPVSYDNSESPGGSGNPSEAGDSASSRDPADIPVPVTDFVNTVKDLSGMDEERTADLLDDLLESEQTEITSSMVDEAGGRQEVIDMALGNA